MKTCSKCKVKKPLDQFHKKTKSQDGHTPECKDCAHLKSAFWYAKNKEKSNQRSKEWRKNNPEKKKANHLRLVYGLTQEEFDVKFVKQNGCCAICSRKLLKDKHTHVDHCHSTNVVRGILCHYCNTAIGLFDDKVDSMKKAIQYLERNQESK